ncbi:MAG: transferase [Magnetococcales bacterium]|nr:transferase [Magnetococcales bacterium]
MQKSAVIPTTMCYALPETELVDLLAHQLTSLFLFDRKTHGRTLADAVHQALIRTTYCFCHINDKYYTRDGEVWFDPYHSGQYTIFLYYVSHSLWKDFQNPRVASMVFMLNKTLGAVDLFYDVVLPDIFYLDHVMGTTMGRATYGNYFIFSQNCTVGNNRGFYPVFGDHVTLHARAMVVGQCRIGSHVVIAADAYVKDQDIPDNTLVFGTTPNLTLVQKDEPYMRENHGHKWRTNPQPPPLP